MKVALMVAMWDAKVGIVMAEKTVPITAVLMVD